MSPEKCPVCGCKDGVERENSSGHTWDVWSCGFSTQIPGTSCRHASRLAIERAAEIQILKEEGSRDLSGMRDMQAKFIKADHDRRALLAEIERLKAALDSCPKPQFDSHGKAALKWADRRAAQLEDLARLINLCRKVNTSSGIIPALSSMEQLGEELSAADTELIEPSFIEFLCTLCREDRRNQKQEK